MSLQTIAKMVRHCHAMYRRETFMRGNIEKGEVWRETANNWLTIYRIQLAKGRDGL